MYYEKIKCPYCGEKFVASLEEGDNLIRCDDHGGCDRSFVVTALVNVILEYYSLQPVQTEENLGKEE